MGFKIEQGEKFALLAFSGLTIGFDDQTPNPADLGFSCWASGKLPFSLDAWWREQLGKIVSEQLENRCNFVLATKRRARSRSRFYNTPRGNGSRCSTRLGTQAPITAEAASVV